MNGHMIQSFTDLDFSESFKRNCAELEALRLKVYSFFNE